MTRDKYETNTKREMKSFPLTEWEKEAHKYTIISSLFMLLSHFNSINAETTVLWFNELSRAATVDTISSTSHSQSLTQMHTHTSHTCLTHMSYTHTHTPIYLYGYLWGHSLTDFPAPNQLNPKTNNGDKNFTRWSSQINLYKHTHLSHELLWTIDDVMSNTAMR